MRAREKRVTANQPLIRPQKPLFGIKLISRQLSQSEWLLFVVFPTFCKESFWTSKLFITYKPYHFTMSSFEEDQILEAIQTNKTPVILRAFGRAFSVVYLSKAVRWRTFFAKFYESKWGCCILATTCSVGHQCEYSWFWQVWLDKILGETPKFWNIISWKIAW